MHTLPVKYETIFLCKFFKIQLGIVFFRVLATDYNTEKCELLQKSLFRRKFLSTEKDGKSAVSVDTELVLCYNEEKCVMLQKYLFEVLHGNQT